MLTTVYISLGAPRMINHIATPSEVRDGYYIATYRVVRNEIRDHAKERPSKCDPDKLFWNR